MKKIKEWIYNNGLIGLLLIGLSVIYIYSMYNNKPWYDELYTYYYFISRGPIYAAIHWPVPNNHMGYSVIAAFIDYIGDGYWGLRGLSVICSVWNAYLLYRFCKKISTKHYLIVIGCFLGSYLTYSLSFQGRGYALTTTCLLLAMNAMADIAMGEDKVRFYFIWIGALAWGLYTIASSTYWVIPVCITGGLYLLLTKQYKKLAKLIIASVIAAIITFGMYSMVWLAIGSNLLSKDELSSFYGIYQLDIIKQAPFAALNRGMQYMLDTPYIQSIDRKEVIGGLWGYFCSLFDQYYSYINSGFGILINMVYILAVLKALVSLISYIRSKKRKEADANEDATGTAGKLMRSIIIAVFGIVIPLMLIIQSVNPYLRVFSFFAVITGIMLHYMLEGILEFIGHFLKAGEKKLNIIGRISEIVVFVIALVAIMVFTFSILDEGEYPISLADRENDIYNALEVAEPVTDSMDKVYYTDDFQKYILKFYYDLEPEEVSLEEADYIMFSNAFAQGEEQSEWPMLITTDSFDMSYFEDNFRPVNLEESKKDISENNQYIIYERIAR